MAKLTTYQAGYCTHPACVALKGAGLRVCKFPARAYLIETRSQLWLWDTGYASHFTTQTQEGVYRLYPKVTPVHFEPHEALVTQLHAQNIGGKEIAGLIISHFHGDHIAGLNDFPNVRLYCSQKGWDYIRPLKGLSAVLKGFVPGLIPQDAQERIHFVEDLEQATLPGDLAPFTTGWVLPDSHGEVFIIELPGHARGQLGLFIQTENGWVLLAADAAWSSQNYTEMRLPSTLARLVMDNHAQFVNTLQQLNQLHNNGKVDIRLCHEGEL